MHAHVYERFAPQTPTGALDFAFGIRQITAGTGGYSLYPFETVAPNSEVRINDAYGVLKLTLHETGYDWQFLPIVGQTSTDSGSAACHGAPPPSPPPPPPPQESYRSTVLADNPRSYHRLGEASGTVAVDETGGDAGTYQNGVALGATGAIVGDPDTAVQLDGSDDRVSMGDPASGSLDFGTGDFSVEAWVRTTVNGERAVLSKRPSAGPYWQFTVTDDSGHVGEIRANVSDGVTSRQAYGASIRVDDGAWHHVVVVFDRDVGVIVYVDGIGLTTLGSITGDVANAGNLLVGKATGYGYFSGDIDDVALYAGLLSAFRISAHFTAGRG